MDRARLTAGLNGVTYGILGLGAVTTLWFMWRAGGEPSQPSWWLGVLPFAAWALAPYAAAALAVWRLRHSRVPTVVLFIAALLLSGFSVWVLYQVFVINLDAQSGLVFLFLPFWQLLALSPLFILAVRSRARASR